MEKLTYGSLFSGIGGIDLGLDRAGFQCQWQVEINEYAQKVLAKHWPDVARYGDIRTVGKHNLTSVDLIAGGFPCQDISIAGKRAGITGSQSGLWSEFYRIICELRPAYVLVENVAALLYGGIDRVLGDLSESGYDAEWQVLSAEAIGAPHLRERVFIVAYSNCRGCRQAGQSRMGEPLEQWRNPSNLSSKAQDTGVNVADANSIQWDRGRTAWNRRDELTNGSQDVSYPDRQSLAVGVCFGGNAREELTAFKRDCSEGTGQWATEPAILRVADGISNRVDRIRGLGNAVVPQVAEYLGRCIVKSHERRK